MEPHYAFRFVALERTDGKAPTRVQIMRDGNLGWLGFENMELNEKSAQNVIDHFDKAGVDLPIDYHHATVKEEEGKTDKAPAAGWIKAGSLEYIPGDGLYGDVTWNPEAKAEIEAEEYKYLSPVVLSNKEDEIVLLHSVALTNRPRTTDQIELLQAAELLDAAVTGKGDLTVPKPAKLKVVTAQEPTGEPAPLPAVDETQKLLADLIAVMQEAGLTVADEAPLAEVLMVAIDAVKGAEVKEPEEAPGEEVAADAGMPEASATAPCAEAGTSAAAATVPCKTAESAEVCALRVKAEAYDKMNERVKVLEAEASKKRVDELIEAEVAAGRILPDDTKMIAAARGLAASDEKQFKLIYSAMAPVCEPGRVVSPTAADKKEAQKGDRAKLIAASTEQWSTDGAGKFGDKLRYYVGAALDEAGEPDLNDAEIEQLEKVEA